MDMRNSPPGGATRSRLTLSADPVGTSDEIDLRALVGTLRRQASLIILTLILCTGLAVAYLASVTPLFRSTALVLVDPIERDLLAPDAQGALNQSAANSRVESEVEILRSDGVALTVVRDERLVSDPEFGPQVGLRERIERAIGIDRDRVDDPQTLVRATLNRFQAATSVRRRGLTYIIEVSISSASPERAAELTNALAESYIAQQLDSKIASALAARDILQNQLVTAERELSSSERALDDFIREQVVLRGNIGSGGDLTLLLSSLEVDEASRLQAEVALSQTQDALRNSDWATLVAGLESEALSELERQRAGIERRLGNVVEDSAVEQDLRAELQALETEIEEQAARELQGLQAQVSALNSREAAARQELREAFVGEQLPPELLTQVFSIQQDAAIARTQYQNLLARLNDVETRAGLQVADSRIVSPALIPNQPYFPNTRLVLALAAVLGLGLGVFLAFVREFAIGGFASPEQLQSSTRMRVATSIPLKQTTGEGQLTPADLVVDDPLSSFSEALRRLRASIDIALSSRGGVRRADEGEGKVVLVTSSVPGEGKTTTALALSRTYAMAGKKVLLIDADLRKPSLHKVTGIVPAHGLSEFLKNPAAFQNLKDVGGFDPLTEHMLLLGKSNSAAPTDSLLTSGNFDLILKEARHRYDVIVLDTPPILPVVDVRYLAPHADVVAVVVKFAATSQGDVRLAVTNLRDACQEECLTLAVLSQRTGGKSESYQYDYAYGKHD
jgi:succinoglycan biosynthesis transport protein ExoP